MIKEDISVIIPVYNNPGVIKAIDSILNQIEYSVAEIIVVDDGSKDNTYEELNKFKQDNDLKCLRILTQKNAGPSAARNNGVKNSSSKYVAFLDSDDQWHKDKLKKQMEIFASNQNIKLVSTSINNITFSGLDKNQEITFDMLLYRNYLYTSTIIVQREVFNEVGYFNEKQRYSEDYDLWLRIAKKYKCVLINEGCVTYGEGKSTFGASGLSSKLWKMEQGELQNYRRLLEENDISLSRYLSVSVFSIIKYIRRTLIVFGKKFKNPSN